MNTKEDRKEKENKIFAILSDYDGTLCPTSAIRDRDNQGRVPAGLRKVLQQISNEIPICILSSKDFTFLSDKIPFACAASCLLGIETIVFGNNMTLPHDRVQSRHLLVDKQVLGTNAEALEKLAIGITSNFAEVAVERKFTYDGVLAGVTADWRDLDDWMYYKKGMAHYVKAALWKMQHYPAPVDLYLQTYHSHPFIDIYASRCDKGVGFDCIVSEILHSKDKDEQILYLGDSENDNPAFRKAGASIGVQSDDRLKTKLECNYIINYAQLSTFLTRLMENDFIFTEDILM